MLSVRQLAQRYGDFRAAGVELVAVFHSPASALREYARGSAAVPYPVLADPERRSYRSFGIERGLWTLLDPRAFARALAASRAGLRPRWRDAWRDGIGIVPADFLVGPDGVLERVHYGAHFADPLPVETALAWAGATA